MREADLSVLGAENQFDLIGRQWMLITAGTSESLNTMTASWVGFGWLWNKPVAFIFVRPERYTHDFIEKSEKVSLSFYPESRMTHRRVRWRPESGYAVSWSRHGHSA